MKPLPWSHSALEDFVNCPRAFHEKRVTKTVKEAQGEEAAWGERVHKAFQLRQETGAKLPMELELHEPFMAFLAAKPGTMGLELKVALDRTLKPCAFFGAEVWFRGVIDFQRICDNYAVIVDYKTGKPHSKFRQLDLFALYTFYAHPEITLVNVQYYWTKTMTVTRKVYGRVEIPNLWGRVLPDLKQYREAFETDTWQPRQSGLCKAHCPVLECEFNGRR